MPQNKVYWLNRISKFAKYFINVGDGDEWNTVDTTFGGYIKTLNLIEQSINSYFIFFGEPLLSILSSSLLNVFHTSLWDNWTVKENWGPKIKKIKWIGLYDFGVISRWCMFILIRRTSKVSQNWNNKNTQNIYWVVIVSILWYLPNK